MDSIKFAVPSIESQKPLYKKHYANDESGDKEDYLLLKIPIHQFHLPK